MPAGQLVHTTEPVASEYRPGGQLRQPPPLTGAYRPTAHEEQTEGEVAPNTPEELPAGHALHAAAPVRSPYVSSPQSEQVFAPGAEYVPTPQLAHAVASVAATVGEYKPASHGVQVPTLAAPSCVENAPATQPRQTAEFDAPNCPE